MEYRISRYEAEKLIGKKQFRGALAALPAGHSGNMYCLPTGAKLNVRNAKQGRFCNYSVYGYQPDESDLIEAFKRRDMTAPCVRDGSKTEVLINVGPFSPEAAEHLKQQRRILSKLIDGRALTDEEHELSIGLQNFLDYIADELHDKHGYQTLWRIGE